MLCCVFDFESAMKKAAQEGFLVAPEAYGQLHTQLEQGGSVLLFEPTHEVILRENGLLLTPVSRQTINFDWGILPLIIIIESKIILT